MTATATDVLDRLAAHGIRVRAHAGQVMLTPRDRVTAELAGAVIAVKPALLRLLTVWDGAHARDAIAGTLERIEDAYPQHAPLGTTWRDRQLADLWESVNVAAQRRDRAEFDDVLARLERHVTVTYGRACTVTP